jgi:hypothetical protein
MGPADCVERVPIGAERAPVIGMHDAPDLEVRYRTLDRSADLAAYLVEFFLLRRQFAAGRLAVWRDEPETEIPEIADGVREGQDVRRPACRNASVSWTEPGSGSEIYRRFPRRSATNCALWPPVVPVFPDQSPSWPFQDQHGRSEPSTRHDCSLSIDGRSFPARTEQ